MRYVLPVFLAVLTVLSVVTAPVAAVEDPRFEAHVPEPELQPGTAQTLTVTLLNDAEDPDDQVETATNVRVTARDGSTPIDVVSGTRLLGTMQDGTPTTVDFRVEVPANASGGTYQLPIDVIYEYDGDEREQTTVYAAVEIPERPIFAIDAVDSDLFMAETGVVTLSMTNVGTRAATDTQIELASTTPDILVGGGQSVTTFAGRWQPGAEKQLAFPVTATQTAMAREYALVVQPSYRTPEDVPRDAPPQSVGIGPADTHRLAVVESTADVGPGETGTLQVTLENRGDTTLRDASVRLESDSPALSFEGDTRTTEFLGTWASGETRTLSVDVSVAGTADQGEQSVLATASFDHSEGIRSQSGPYDVAVPISAEQTVAYTDVRVDMRGSSAVLTADVRNTGDRQIRNAVVSLDSTSPAIQVTDPTQSVGTLGPGDSVPVSFDLAVAPNTNPGPRQFSAQVQYESGGSRTATTAPTAIQVSLPTDQDLFSIEPVNATLGVDTSNVLQVRIRNDGEETLRNVRATLQPHLPYQSQSPTAYVERLEPGESALLSFELTTPDDGVETEDAIAMNVTAETPRDRTVVDGPHLVPFAISTNGSPASDTTALVIGAVLVIVILGAGWWWLNR